ncbi:hypothetical protein BHM03_00028813 [Ensete ventricosum]|nr:hypothetical protein BHM03_00028813 [Ensete ventricosum]
MIVITVEATVSPLVLLLPVGLHRVGRPEEPLFSDLKENFGLSGIERNWWQPWENMGDDHLDYLGQGLHLMGEPKEGLERGDEELDVECWRGKSWIIEQLLIMTRSMRQRISFPGGEGERLSSSPRDMLGDMDFFPRVARQ